MPASNRVDLLPDLIEAFQNDEDSEDWKKDNLEHDLRCTEWICAKAKESEYYAQNLYAAMCNNVFQRNDVWPILADKTWSCSWRYAGGIVADMLDKGDYLDWYCSGIKGTIDNDEFRALGVDDQERYLYIKNNYVGEGYVTDEIRDDLLKLGWAVLPGNYD